MRSAASYNGHPIHPALIPFPFAFLVGALVADAAGRVTDHEPLWRTGWHLAVAGVVMALVAAVPGFIDLAKTVPPNSTGKRRARQHAALNLGAVVLFAASAIGRSGDTHAPSALALALELVGAALLVRAGWLGGVLVNRNQIGVDPRYAGAGKWREATIARRPGEAAVVARADELAVDQMKLLRVGDRRLVLARTEQGYVAFSDHCTHRGGSLAGGAMIFGTVQCPWHGSQFDVRTGAVRAGPAREPIETFRVEERGGEVLLLD